MGEVPAIRIIVEAIDGTISTREANIVKTSYGQPTVCSNVDKVLLFPSLDTETAQNLKLLILI